ALPICKDLITFVKDRPGHDLRYAIDYICLKNELNWQPKVFLKKGIEKTINWYLNNKNWWMPLIK
ncbi:dTDP-glucose 4,6-dehydratase, partial [Prochlorococcus sp. HOT_208_60]